MPIPTTCIDVYTTSPPTIRGKVRAGETQIPVRCLHGVPSDVTHVPHI